MSALTIAAVALAIPRVVLLGRPPQIAGGRAVQGAALAIVFVFGARAIARASLARGCRWKTLAHASFVVMIVAFGVALATAYSALFTTIPWRARVISIDGDLVCTVVDKGEWDQGWASPFCLGRGRGGDFVDELGQRVAVAVGDCVRIKNVHPDFYVLGRVPCHA